MIVLNLNKFEHRDTVKWNTSSIINSLAGCRWDIITVVHMIIYLKGIVYYMKNHFTSRIIFKDREIWFNENYSWRQKY